MFTGIVEELGEITGVAQLGGAARLTVRGPVVSSDAKHGDSIAVSGVCLTVVEVRGAEFTADVVNETLERSRLAGIVRGDRVNLERATAVGDRLGGHIMQGHVDGTGVYRSRDENGLTRFSLPPGLSRYVVEKGSIAVDGISLTVTSVTKDEFTVALIPTTLELTTLGRAEPGDLVNLEVDVLAKYIEKLASPHLDRVAEHNGVSSTQEDA
ncbi:MAG TPA: riboflavin synthase [Amycolatopsis sp.]|nr:riboflavin synthase [Amycolatopsis sp.]